MRKVSRDGKGKTLYIPLSVYSRGGADPAKNLTISCPDKETRFRLSLSDNGLRRFRGLLQKFYREQVLERRVN